MAASRAFLQSILPKNVQYLIKDLKDIEDQTENSSFLATVHLKIETSEDVKLWKDEFSRLSRTSWIVLQTYPNIRKYQFKKRWICRRSSKGKVDCNSDTRNELVKINANCESIFSVIIRKNTVATRRSNESVRQGFLCELKIVWKHTHKVGDDVDVDSLLKLKVNPRICEDYEKYFEMGLAASKAREHHVEMLELKPDFDESVTLADSSLNPKLRVVTHLFEQWRTKNHGGREGETRLKVLYEKILELQGKGTLVGISEAPFAVAILTPIAQRVHQLNRSSMIAFMDSTSSCDLKSHTLTFMLCPSAAGALPLGYLITDGQGELAYTTGLQLLKGIIGDQGFGGQKYPNVFMTDESDAERAALKTVWPLSDQKGCQFHSAQAMWRWIWDGKHQIDANDRRTLMAEFLAIMDSLTKESACYAFETALSSQTADKYLLYQEHISSLWERTDPHTGRPRREQWCTAWREGAVLGNNTNNYSEACVRIFKDVVLSRNKAFNPVSLLTFIGDKTEVYYRNRLLDFAHGRVTAHHIMFESLKGRANYVEGAHQIIQVAEKIYKVPSSQGDKYYQVNVELNYCSCPSGFTGALCKHQFAVSQFCPDVNLFNEPQVTAAHRYFMARVALGQKAKEPKFYGVLYAYLKHHFFKLLLRPLENCKISPRSKTVRAIYILFPLSLQK